MEGTSSSNSEEPLISILIPWIAGRGIAARAIGSWTRSQARSGTAVEVIVATSGGGREVAAALGDLIDGFGIKLLTQAGKTYAELINACARHAKAPWLLITESHVEPRPDCVARVAEWIRKESSGLMGAPITTFSRSRTRVGRLESDLFQAASQGWNDSSHWHNVRIRGTVIRARFFLEAGGFDARYELACDIAFGLEARKQGYEFGRIPAAQADHWENTNLWGSFGDAYSYSRGEAAFRLYGSPCLAEQYLGRSKVFKSLLKQPRRSKAYSLQLRLLLQLCWATLRVYTTHSDERRLRNFRKAFVCGMELGRSVTLKRALVAPSKE